MIYYDYEIYRVQWSYFNIPMMIFGILLCGICLVGMVASNFSPSSFVGIFLSRSTTSPQPLSVPLRDTFSSISSVVSCAIVIFHWIAPLSNSFIAGEVQVCFFSVQVITMFRTSEIILVSLNHLRCEASKNEKLSVSIIFRMLVGALALELVTLCIMRWLLDLWRDEHEANIRNPFSIIMWDIVGPLAFFLASCVTVSILLSGSSCITFYEPVPHSESRIWNRSRSQRFASKSLLVLATLALVPHCIIYQTDILDGWKDTDPLTNSTTTDFTHSCLNLFLGVIKNHSNALQYIVPTIVFVCNFCGLCLELAQFFTCEGGGPRRRQKALRSLLFGAHMSCLIIMVSVSIKHHAVLLITGQLWCTVCLVGSYALISEAIALEESYNSNNNDSDKYNVTHNGILAKLQCADVLSWQRQHSFQLAVQLCVLGRLLFFLSNHQYDFGTMQVC